MATTEASCCTPAIQSLTDQQADELAATLKALADPTRVRLLNIIAAAGEACACDFPGLIDKSQPTISHHLSLLTNAGILHREQRGKWAWFRVNNERIAGLQAAIGQACC